MYTIKSLNKMQLLKCLTVTGISSLQMIIQLIEM